MHPLLDLLIWFIIVALIYLSRQFYLFGKFKIPFEFFWLEAMHSLICLFIFLVNHPFVFDFRNNFYVNAIFCFFSPLKMLFFLLIILKSCFFFNFTFLKLRHFKWVIFIFSLSFWFEVNINYLHLLFLRFEVLISE